MDIHRPGYLTLLQRLTLLESIPVLTNGETGHRAAVSGLDTPDYTFAVVSSMASPSTNRTT